MAIRHLSVIESPYMYNAWKAGIDGNGKEYFESQEKYFTGPRTSDWFRENKVYDAAGVPVDITVLDHTKDPGSQPCAAVTRQVSDLVFRAVSDGSKAVMVNGYCNYAPAVAGGIQRAIGPDRTLGLIWIDAHSDCRIVTADEPRRLVAVPMSTMLGKTLDGYRTQVCRLAEPIIGSNIVAGDVRFMDETSGGIFEKEGVIRLDGTAFADRKRWEDEVGSLAERVDAIYISVDADILKAQYIPSYIKAVPYGHDPETVAENVAAAVRTGKAAALSLFCFDFDLWENGGETTCRSAACILESALKNWK